MENGTVTDSWFYQDFVENTQPVRTNHMTGFLHSSTDTANTDTTIVRGVLARLLRGAASMNVITFDLFIRETRRRSR